jgi:hypothetical protein
VRASAYRTPYAVPFHRAIQTPALVGVSPGGVLKYFPIGRHGGNDPQVIARIPNLRAGAMAGNGNEVAIVNQHPPGIVLYDVATHALKRFADPNGTPIDIAIDKNANLFVLNVVRDDPGNVTMYRANSSQPVELNCRYIGLGVAIAADDEGDIFVNGYQHSFTGVSEIPNGPNGPQPSKCRRLDLRPEHGYVAGVAIDPKTNDLIVLDDPDLCAGGVEGRMTIYPKPYRGGTARSVDLNGNCVGQLRLDAASRLVFSFDQNISGGSSYVIQRGYPGGRDLGAYHRGNLIGVTTIPNTLPN